MSDMVNGKGFYSQYNLSRTPTNQNGIWFVEEFGGNEYSNWIIGRIADNFPKGIAVNLGFNLKADFR